MRESEIGAVVFGLIGVVVLALLAYVLLFEKRRALARLLGRRVERAAVVRLGGAVHYVVATIEGLDRERVRAGLDSVPCSLVRFEAADGWEGDAARNILVEACRHAIAEVVDGALAPGSAQALRARLDAHGFALHDVRVALRLADDDHAARLAGWWVATVSYLDDTGKHWTCDALELFLDAKSGVGHWKLQRGRERSPSSVLLTAGGTLRASRGPGEMETVAVGELFGRE